MATILPKATCTANVHLKHIEVFWQSFDRDAWGQILQNVKRIQGASYNPKQKIWIVPNSRPIRDYLESIGFELVSMRQPVATQTFRRDLVPQGLRPYQLAALDFLNKVGGRGLIADEMGTGKTVMSLAWAASNPTVRPVVVVVKAALKTQWARQISRWCPNEKVVICNGKRTRAVTSDFYVINWDILTYWVNDVGNFRGCSGSIGMVISDEVQATGNPSSQRTKAWARLIKRAPHHISLSGTPFTTRPAQFYSILHDLAAPLFPNYHRYLNRYCAPKWNGFGWDYNGASNVAELSDLVKDLMIRRTKAEVLPDLPKKQTEVIYLECKEHSMTVEEFMEKLQEQGSTNLPLNVDTLFLYNDKRDALISYITDWLEDTVDMQLVIYAWHRAVVEDLAHTFAKYSTVMFYGGLNDKERQAAIDGFKNGTYRIFVANMQSGGVGVDGLQEVCRTAMFAEFSMVPADHLQAEDRLHRIGQETPVDIQYLVSVDSIEEKWMKILSARSTVMGNILDGGGSLLQLSVKLKEREDATMEQASR
jgi:SWI/SNF-related matrix-associated actin-dependent regulator 1 of chromatin subfamily A